MRRRLPPVPGRFWWAEALCAMAAGAAAVVGPVWYLSTQLPLDKELGQGIGSDLALSVGLGLALLMFSAFYVHYAARELYRWRMRRAALLDNGAILPLAHGLATAPEPPEVSLQPLELLWSARPGQRLLATPLYLLLILLDLGQLALSVIVVVAGLASPVQHLALALRLVLLTSLVFIVAAAIAITVLVARLMPTYLFGRPYGVVASVAGLEFRTEFGRRFTDAWGGWEALRGRIERRRARVPSLRCSPSSDMASALPELQRLRAGWD